MSSPSSYFASAFAQASGRVLAIGANLLSLVLVARLLGPERFGEYGFVMAYVNVACSLADLGTTSVLGQGLVRVPKDSRGAYLGSFYVVRGAITAVATLVALLAAPLAKPELAPLLVVGSLAVPVVASRFFDPLFQVYERARYSVVTSVVYAVSLVLVSVIILGVARMSLFEFLLGWAASNLLYTLAALGLALHLARPRFCRDRTSMRSILTLAAPLGVGAFFYILNTRADTLMLAYLRPIHEVGLYSAAFKLVDLGGIAATTLLWPLIPILSRAIAESQQNARLVGQHVAEVVGLVCLPLVATAPFLALPAMSLLYGPGYADAARVVVVFAVVFVVLAFSLLGVVLNLAAGRVQFDYWNAALALAIHVPLSLVLIPRYGFVGAAYATLASYLSMLAVQQYYVLRNVGRLYQPAFWIRLAAITLALFGALAVMDAWTHPLLVVPGLLAYLAVVWWLKLVPGGQHGLLRVLSGRRDAARDSPGVR